MKKKTSFEIWQVVNMTIQSMLLLAAFLGALYVGLKQYEINEKLLELQYQPSVEIAMADGERLHVNNKGSHSIWLWGTEVESCSKEVEKNPRLITPGGYYYIPADNLKKLVRERLKGDGELWLNSRFFFTTSNDRKYLVRNIFYCTVSKGAITIHSQTIGITNEEWGF